MEKYGIYKNILYNIFISKVLIKKSPKKKESEMKRNFKKKIECKIKSIEFTSK